MMGRDIITQHAIEEAKSTFTLGLMPNNMSPNNLIV
jgi:hypothetical protein